MDNKLANPLTEDNQHLDVESITHKRPDEKAGLNIEARFKISDPETGEVIVEGRA